MIKKAVQLEILDRACEACKEEHGTIRTHGLDYNYYIRKQIEHCTEMGATRDEIQAVLDKYSEQINLPVNDERRCG